MQNKIKYQIFECDFDRKSDNFKSVSRKITEAKFWTSTSEVK